MVIAPQFLVRMKTPRSWAGTGRASRRPSGSSWSPPSTRRAPSSPSSSRRPCPSSPASSPSPTTLFAFSVFKPSPLRFRPRNPGGPSPISSTLRPFSFGGERPSASPLGHLLCDPMPWKAASEVPGTVVWHHNDLKQFSCYCHCLKRYVDTTMWLTHYRPQSQGVRYTILVLHYAHGPESC